MTSWLKNAALVVVLIAGVVFLWRAVFAMAAGVAVLIVVAFGVDRSGKWWAIRRFRADWGTRGRDLLLVYSNSPHWQSHVEGVWLQRWGHRAVVLNWSDRGSWERPGPSEVQLFRKFSGRREFNPIAIVVPPRGRKVHVVRFWQAFRDRKHGKHESLSKAETELESHLSAAATLDKTNTADELSGRGASSDPGIANRKR